MCTSIKSLGQRQSVFGGSFPTSCQELLQVLKASCSATGHGSLPEVQMIQMRKHPTSKKGRQPRSRRKSLLRTGKIIAENRARAAVATASSLRSAEWS